MVVCDVTKKSDLQNLMNKTIEEFKGVDVWINNAGINQPMIPIWEVETEEVEEKKLPIRIGVLAPGIMITDFITHSMGNDAFEQVLDL